MLVCILLIISVATSFLSVKEANAKASKVYSGYIDNVKITRTGSKVTVNYRVRETIPNGATLTIGYEDYSGYCKDSQFAGKKGKHKVTWTVASPLYRIYTKLLARDYTDKDIVKKIFACPSSFTKKHKVTEGEENANLILYFGLNIALDFTMAGEIVSVSKSAITVYTIIRYAGSAYEKKTQKEIVFIPRKGNYIVTKGKFNKKTSYYTITNYVYKSKKAYKNKKKPIKKFITMSYKIAF